MAGRGFTPPEDVLMAIPKFKKNKVGSKNDIFFIFKSFRVEFTILRSDAQRSAMLYET